MPSIKTLLAQASQRFAAISESPQLDAEVLLCHVLQKNRSYLRAWPDHTPDTTQLELFQQLCQQRQQGQPIAYLTGVREFWSREFVVTPDVLIPRPDTELLIELSLTLIPANTACHILDLGTGSGIIAITLAAERPNTQVSATDLSPKALAIARQNAAKHKLNNVNFYLSDWFTSIPDQHFRLIVSNPPYIDPQDTHLQQGDVRFEPDSALIAADHGLQDIKTIVENARNWLETGGHLLIEHGYDQEAAVQAIFRRFAYRNIKTYYDLSGQARVIGGEV